MATRSAPKKKAAAPKKKAVATRSKTEIVASTPLDFEADAGSGFEGVDRECMAVPFLRILQGLSPAVIEETVEGAKPGLFINSVTNALFGNAVRIIPVAFQRRWNRWVPRDEGGGFRGELTPAEFNELERNGEITRNEDGFFVYGDEDVLDTRNHFILLENDETGTWSPAVISLVKSGLKHSKRFVTIMDEVKLPGKNGKLFTPPTYSHIYIARTVKETNDQGTWYNWTFELDGPVSDPELYSIAKDFHNRIITGKVETAAPEMEAESAGEGF